MAVLGWEAGYYCAVLSLSSCTSNQSSTFMALSLYIPVSVPVCLSVSLGLSWFVCVSLCLVLFSVFVTVSLWFSVCLSLSLSLLCLCHCVSLILQNVTSHMGFRHTWVFTRLFHVAVCDPDVSVNVSFLIFNRRWRYWFCWVVIRMKWNRVYRRQLSSCLITTGQYTFVPSPISNLLYPRDILESHQSGSFLLMWPALSPFSDQPMEPWLAGTIFHPIGLFPAVSCSLLL